MVVAIDDVIRSRWWLLLRVEACVVCGEVVSAGDVGGAPDRGGVSGGRGS
jgi:hypothetical protein